MAAPKSTDADIAKWHKIISDGEVSGLSAKEYCEKKDINPKTYSAWKKRLSSLGKELPKSLAPGAESKKPLRKPYAAKQKHAKEPASQPAKVAPIAPHFGKTPETTVDVAAFTLSVTLPNGLGVEVKCATEVEFDAALVMLSKMKV